MKKILMTFLCFVYGCGYVSQEDLTRHLRASEQETRNLLSTEMNNGDVATFECGMTSTIYRQATLFCEETSAYCNVVQLWDSYCLRFDEEQHLLPPQRGVAQAVDLAVQQYNMSSQEESQEDNNTQE